MRKYKIVKISRLIRDSDKPYIFKYWIIKKRFLSFWVEICKSAPEHEYDNCRLTFDTLKEVQEYLIKLKNLRRR